jgi:LCP family protein required for cell wall assembly
MSPIARHGRLARRRAVTTIFALLGGVLAVALVSTVAVAGVAAWQLTSNLGPGVDIGQEGEPIPQTGAIEGPVNILLVGSDSGGGNKAYGSRGETLNDVTILLHISPVSHTATAVSFPRDLLVAIPSCPKEDGSGNYSGMSRQKINVSLSYGGLRCTVMTVEKLTGLEIPYAAMIEFDGVIQMSNAVGGVEVCLAKPLKDKYVGLDLPAGTFTLAGADALQFLRSRHGVGDGSDLNRISSQQVFLSALIRKIKSEEVLTNPITLYSLAKAATQYMQLSTSLNHLDTMYSMALALKDIPLTSVVFVQYPSSYTPDFLSVTPRTGDASILMDAIARDVPIIVQKVGDGAVGGEQVTETATPSPSDSASPSVEPTPSEVVTLPPTITGQTAGEQTCSAGSGNGGG